MPEARLTISHYLGNYFAIGPSALEISLKFSVIRSGRDIAGSWITDAEIRIARGRKSLDQQSASPVTA